MPGLRTWMPLALLAVALSVDGAETPAPAWLPMNDAQLDELRGGFDTVNGLQLSFGIERATYINGELVAQQRVEIPDIAHMTTEQAQALDQAARSVVLVQNGPDNHFDVGSVAPGSTVIQNTLNDQHIVNLTTITAGANTLAMFQGLNAQDSLQQSLNRVVGAR